MPQDAAMSHWCDTQHKLFCADFDEQSDFTTLAASWTTYSTTNGKFSLVTSNNNPSPPNSLEIVASDHANALLEKQFVPAVNRRPARARLEFDLRIDQAAGVGLLSAAGFAAIAIGTSTSDGVVAMAIGNGPTLAAAWVNQADAGASDAGTYGAANSTQPFPPTNMWSGRYALEIQYPATGPACAQIYAGGTALLASCVPLPPQLSNPRQFVIALGESAGGLGNTGLIQLQFDNVTFDLQ
jgi:hypothetical protein